MPSRLACLLIFLLWGGSMAWLAARDLVPALGLGEITYERALATRAVEEPVEWNILRNDAEVGNVYFAVHPRSNGTFELESKASLRLAVVDRDLALVHIDSVVYVNPLRQLDHFEVIVSLSASNMEIRIEGKPNDRQLFMTLALEVGGVEQIKRSISVPFDPKAMVLDTFGQLDRLPDLRPGKSWRTQFVNPLGALLGGDLWAGRGMESIEHHVVGTETVQWEGEEVLCYKVEHRYQRAVTHSWARATDGKVIIQEVLFGTESYRLVAERSIHDRPPTPNGARTTP